MNAKALDRLSREMLNVTNSDPTGRLSAQIKQAMLQGGIQW